MLPKLVKGESLTAAQVREVKAAFLYRWTIENEARARVAHKGQPPTIALIADEQWLKEHAFYIRKDGRLATRPAHCEPSYMASL